MIVDRDLIIALCFLPDALTDLIYSIYSGLVPALG